MDATEEKNKGNKTFKIVVAVILALIVLPIIVLSILYNSNKAFKQSMNNTFSKMPGPIGGYFSNYPTEEEKSDKIDYLSRHFLNLEENVAADKIYIIKKEDEELYFDLIRDMNSVSPKKTEDIILKIRNMELRKDLLVSTYEEAMDNEKERMLSEVTRIENQDILLSLAEIENKFTNKDFLEILNKVEENKLSKLLYYIDDDISEYILNTFKEDKNSELQRLIYKLKKDEDDLKDVAKLYETKPIDKATNEIGSFESYSIEELAIIYMNLSDIKAAELLYNIGDEKFTEELFVSISRQEDIIKSGENVIENISKAMEFISEYNIKINELVQTYEKMTPGKIAKIVEEMIDETQVVTFLELKDGNAYNLSDKIIIIDVLSDMKSQTLSKVLDFMEAKDASKVTRELAKPKENN